VTAAPTAITGWWRVRYTRYHHHAHPNRRRRPPVSTVGPLRTGHHRCNENNAATPLRPRRLHRRHPISRRSSSSRVPQTPEPPSPPRKSATPEPPAPSIEKLSADASPTAASEEKESDVAHSPLRGGTAAPPNAPPVADSPAVRLQRIREQRAAREASAGRHEDAGHDPSTPPPRAVSSTPPPPPQEPSGPAPIVAESPAERLRRIREHRGAVSSAAHTQGTNGLAAAPSGAVAAAPSDAALTETPAERMRRIRAARAAEGAHAETESVVAEAATVAPERFSFTPSALMASRSEPAPANVTAPPPAQDSAADAVKTADAEPVQPKTSTAARAKLEALRAARTASGYL
jgi:hypothetical protein